MVHIPFMGLDRFLLKYGPCKRNAPFYIFACNSKHGSNIKNWILVQNGSKKKVDTEMYVTEQECSFLLIHLGNRSSKLAFHPFFHILIEDPLRVSIGGCEKVWWSWKCLNRKRGRCAYRSYYICFYRAPSTLSWILQLKGSVPVLHLEVRSLNRGRHIRPVESGDVGSRGK